MHKHVDTAALRLVHIALSFHLHPLPTSPLLQPVNPIALPSRGTSFDIIAVIIHFLGFLQGEMVDQPVIKNYMTCKLWLSTNMPFECDDYLVMYGQFVA